MDVAELVRSATLAHGHSCPPLVLGVRAGVAAMARLGVGRAVDRGLFAFVELGSDHYAQGFADGIQFATGCTFGKDLIVRLPHGKASVRLVDQARARAIRVAVRPETLARLEASDWFLSCAAEGTFTKSCAVLAAPLVEEYLSSPDDALFTASEPFALKIEHPHPRFESAVCESCGESVLAAYVRRVDGLRVCVSCEERARSLAG
jgi:formylmethanofuran dehydrogenase subunit E